MYTETYYEQVEKKKQKLDKTIDPDVNEVVESALPSRMELYHSKKKKKKKGSRFPLLKVLLTFFILLPVSTIAAYTYFSQQSSSYVNKSTPTGGEEILYDTSRDDTVSHNPIQDQHMEQTENEDKISESGSYSNDIPSHAETKVSSAVEVNDQNNKYGNDETVDSNNSSKEQPQLVNHIVEPNETLFSISMKYYHSQAGIEKIIEQNHIVNNEIKVGETLQIPLSK
ncbi:LysM peptidoglycan-binding domain-containing protein [Bacillus sp. FJAT-49736]|uniref:LysM peptidoglycan-binding domain-containing protein n=1 Tax=Bacillus sp. FJAT-49736 TaxID=2833582 RepID=UPI001BC9727E|nr:LysM peptidoglycan-binding domain-containing protein [Bacillus sp. FJAT-49736]MBS4173310.1 LysM peptidoglycan-binding domain-containing protein [Bacillus sp. FJAT-49736]